METDKGTDRLVRDAQQAFRTQHLSAEAESKKTNDALNERKRAAARGTWLEPYVGPDTTFPIRLGESGAGLTIYWSDRGVSYIEGTGRLEKKWIEGLAQLGSLLDTYCSPDEVWCSGGSGLLVRDALLAYEAQCRSEEAESDKEYEALGDRMRVAAQETWLGPYVGPDTVFPIRLGESGASLKISWNRDGVPYVEAMGGPWESRIKDLAYLGSILSTALSR